ncbi:hypothetical protein [uncultured Litoreibacter sp.]|uniref:hypothetical protein n=1 Tax=uncultured Litoreibacter sp. TaxID=1392394 RepID=UPI002630061D|nr:hypothetical protein [uncultured Litoreibacter sp.]
MPNIPNQFSEVTMEFAPGVNKEVSQNMLTALNETISKNAVAGQTIEKLWVSSAKDSHSCPSRHVSGLAVDISRVNGKKIGEHYVSDAAIRAIVDGLQAKFEMASNRRENFGPTIKKKLGQNHDVSGHVDHFHWSVNGDHSACSDVAETYRLEEEDNPQTVSQR